MNGPIVNRWRDAALIACLLAFGMATKGWVLAQTKVLARDGIGYIHFAQRLSNEPWGEVFSTIPQHPLYSIHISLASHLTQAITGSSDNVTWQWTAQLANALCGVLLAIPMYLLGAAVFGRAVGFWAAFLFQAFPVPAHVTSDALSEGAYLFYGVTALYFGVRGLQSSRWGWFFAAGVIGGLAYLARPEGALVVATLGLTILAAMVLRTWNGSQLKALGCGACLGVGTLLIVAPYWLTIGRLSPKPTFHDMLHSHASATSATPDPSQCGRLLLASRFTTGVNGSGEDNSNPWYALFEVLDESSKGFHYVFWIPALIGLFWLGYRLFRQPAGWPVVLLIILQLIVLWRLAASVHYVSERHPLMIVLCGCIVGVATMFDLIGWCWKRVQTNDTLAATGKANAFVVVCILVVAGMGLFRTLRPLHAHRLGHKEAGFWLATQLYEADKVVDPYGWASFYADRPPFKRVKDAYKVNPPASVYVIMEPQETDALRLSWIRKACPDYKRQPPVFTWSDGDKPQVVVYRVQAEFPAVTRQE